MMIEGIAWFWGGEVVRLFLEGSPEQPDRIQRGPATAAGGCERSER